MKKTNFTNPQWITVWLIALSVLTTLLFSANSVSAQCSLAINDDVQISLDAFDCVTQITPDMVLEDPGSCVGAIYQVQVFHSDGTPLHNPADDIVDWQEIGQTVVVVVTDLNTGNYASCNALILDNMAPFIMCPIDTVDIYCFQQDNYKPFAFDNCDTTAVSLIVTNEVITSNECNTNLPDSVFRIIDRRYVALDGSGNYSDTCSVTIRVSRMPIDTFFNNIHFPTDRLVTNGTHISCAASFPTTLNGCCEDTGYPTPAYSGAPYYVVWNNITHRYDTSLLYPTPFMPCNLASTYFDLPINTPNPECVTKFLRVWGVTEWSCSSPERALGPRFQTIEIADTNNPVVVCPDNATITTNSVGTFENTTNGTINCGASYTFPVPFMSDLCSSTLEWDIAVLNDTGFPIEFVDNASKINPVSRVLPYGVNTVTYSVYDACGSSSSCSFTVTVNDVTAPVAVCQQFTTVGLTYDGQAEVFAHSFDSGSYDDCKLDYIEVKRMDNGVPCGLATGDGDVFKDYVTFCCNDIGSYVMVQFRVWDIAGNYNECMVQVEVQDKLPPIITCPDDIYVECDFYYNPENLRAYFGWPVAYDNCDVVITTDSVFNIDQCGIGYIDRTFTATDPGQRTAVCTQRVYLQNSSPFWIDRTNPYSTKDDVIWPETYYGTGCLNPNDLHPDVTGWPQLLEGPCDLAGANWSDDVFFFNDNNQNATEACFKIIRHWKVIDWCQREAYNYGTYLSWTFDQIIMVSDPDGPTITSDCDDKTTCTFDPACVDGYIELTMSATDVCTNGEDLRWTYKIDLDDDNTFGSFDYKSDVLFGANVQALGRFNNGEFPIGTHRIYWTVWDQCGNKTVCDYLFTIMNCKQPTPYCLDQIATTLMGIDTDNDGVADWGMIDVVARDCSPCCLESTHPCGYQVVTSFSSDINDTIRTYTCDNIGENVVEIWASALLPDGSITQDFCVTTIDIQDNALVCADSISPLIQISGLIRTSEDKVIPGVQVELDGSELAPQTTGADGTYSFLASNNGSYTIIPKKDGDDTEGITTLDLVLIQKHLLALKEMDSPYTLIAADVDNNGKVSAADLFTLRKLILGINETFLYTDSWTFVDGAYQFENPLSPFDESYPKTYILNNVNQDMNIDFIGMKMGDINNTVGLLGGNDIVNRNVEALQLEIDEMNFNKGQFISVPFYANNFDKINGFQMTLQFNTANLKFVAVEEGSINMTGNNLGLTQLLDGYIAVSWSEGTTVTAEPSDVLFTLQFEALNSANISQNISINNKIAAIEAYNNSLDVIDLKLNVRNMDDFGFELFQNTPNPFSNVTAISFSLPEAGFATLKIHDVTGRMLNVISGDFSKGINTITLKKSDLDASGILYYQLDTEGYTATKKMIVLR